MITLDTSLIFSTQQYMLKTKRKNPLAYGSINAFTEARATEGTQDVNSSQNVNPDNTVNKSGFSDLDFHEIVKALKMHLPESRLAALRLMNHDDLVKLLYMMDKKDLLIGMKFFTKKKLVNFINNLPKQDILKMLMQLFSKEQLIAMMPAKELSKFMDSTKIDHNSLLKVCKRLPPHILAQIYEAATGSSASGMNNKELLQKVCGMKQNLLVDGIKSLSTKELTKIVSQLLDMNKDLFKEFSTSALVAPFEKMHKTSIIQSMTALEPQQIIKMLGELPNDLLSQVGTLLDPSKFSDVMESQHQDILAMLAGSI